MTQQQQLQSALPLLLHAQPGPLSCRLALSALFFITLISTTRTAYSSAMEGGLGRKFQGREILAGNNWNAIDSCWRTGSANWANERQAMAGCGGGFGGKATGGFGGETYVVSDSSDDAQNPANGTLRFGVTREEALWITFAPHVTTLVLANELLISSNKTIDGRGANVTIGHGGPCFVLDHVSNVIIHGVRFHNCTVGSTGLVRSSPSVLRQRGGSDGDAITVAGSHTVWIDHNSLSVAYDGLIDVVNGSTAVTISNNYFSNHNKVMLLGNSPASTAADTLMNVTVIYNHFGPGLTQRMPRCRFGLVHVINNKYDHGWGGYAIGGSSHPTILSIGNYFKASSKKQVTRRIDSKNWSSWIWKSVNDTFLNGSYFIESGTIIDIKEYGLHTTTKFSSSMTTFAGPLSCSVGSIC